MIASAQSSIFLSAYTLSDHKQSDSIVSLFLVFRFCSCNALLA